MDVKGAGTGRGCRPLLQTGEMSTCKSNSTLSRVTQPTVCVIYTWKQQSLTDVLSLFTIQLLVTSFVVFADILLRICVLDQAV